jgi:hypothetical protein
VRPRSRPGNGTAHGRHRQQDVPRSLPLGDAAGCHGSFGCSVAFSGRQKKESVSRSQTTIHPRSLPSSGIHRFNKLFVRQTPALYVTSWGRENPKAGSSSKPQASLGTKNKLARFVALAVVGGDEAEEPHTQPGTGWRMETWIRWAGSRVRWRSVFVGVGQVVPSIICGVPS